MEAIVQLMAAQAGPGGSPRSSGPSTAGSEGVQGAAADVEALGDVRGGVLFPDFMTLEQGADSWSAAAAQWPASGPAGRSSLLGQALARAWRHGRAGSRRLGRRISASLRGSRADLGREAECLGIHPGEPRGPSGTRNKGRGAAGGLGMNTAWRPCACLPNMSSNVLLLPAPLTPTHSPCPDMLSAVEHVYAMSGPTAASMSVRLTGGDRSAARQAPACRSRSACTLCMCVPCHTLAPRLLPARPCAGGAGPHALHAL